MVKYKIYTALTRTQTAKITTYYLVHCEASTNPDTWIDSYVEYDDFYRNFLLGYTREFGVEQTIDGGEMGTSDVALFDSTPKNLNETKTYSDSQTWEISGKIGVSKDGLSAEVGGGFSHTKSLSWEVTEYKIFDECETHDHLAGARWYADVNLPETGGRNYLGLKSLRYYWGVNATPASTKKLTYESEWIWEVGKDYWKSHPTIKMDVKVWSKDGLTFGRSDAGQYTHERSDTSYEHSESFSLILDQPSHIVVASDTNITAKQEGEDITITFLCDNYWKVESDSDWCKVTSTASGTETGEQEQTVTIRIDPRMYGGDFSTREAVVTVYSILSPNTWPEKRVEIKIKQLAPHILVSSDREISVNADGGEMSFTFWSDYDWTVESNKSWCVIDGKSEAGTATGEAGRKITFNVNGGWAEGAHEARQAIITTRNLNSGETVRSYVNQEASSYSEDYFFNVSAHSLTIPSGGGTTSFILMCNQAWTATSDSDWCVVNASDRSGNATDHPHC